MGGVWDNTLEYLEVTILSVGGDQEPKKHVSFHLEVLTCTLESFLLMEIESPDRSDQRWSSSFAEISQSLKSLTESTYCSCSDTILCMDWTLPFVEQKESVNYYQTKNI